MTDLREDIHTLLVDDDAALADTAAELLEREDERLQVDVVTSVEEAMTRLSGSPIDCIVSDYEMPDTNGLEFLQRVRADHPHLPFLLYTARGSEEVASEAISLGVTDYVQKRTDRSQYTVLANRIRNAVEQYRSRRAAAETERTLSEIAERADDVLFMVSGDWSEVMFINSAFEETWGQSIERLQAEPTAFLEAIHPEDREQARASMDRLSGAESDVIEYRVVPEPGTVRWVRGRSKPILDANGEVDRIVGYVRDITDAVERRQQLERYERLVETLPVAVFRSTVEGTFVDMNDAFVSLVGAETKSEVFDRMAHSFFTDDPPREELIADLREQRTIRDREVRIQTLDREHRWISTTIRLTEEGGEQYLEGISQDITDRKTRERELQELEAQYRQLVEQNLIGIYTIQDREFTYVNPRLAEIFGEQPEDMIGESPFDWIAEEEHDRVRENMRRRETGEVDSLRFTVTGVRSDGERIKFEVHGGIVEIDGDPAILGTLKDVTEREEWERDIRRQNDRLEEFARVVSHDLRNPLSVAMGRVELERDLRDSENLETAVDALERMDALIDDLLALSQEGDSALDRESVALRSVAEGCWRTVRTGDAALAVESTQRIRADPAQLRRLLENLIDNAVRHGCPGVTVTVGDLPDGFYVADDGPGIDSADRDRIFESGYSSAADGTGFGLAIVKEIATIHGWELEVTDSETGGARFEVRGVERPA